MSLEPSRVAAWFNRRRARGVAALFFVLGLGLALWFLSSPRPAETSSGTLVGRLPRGVHQSELNVLLITLDTTRADRMGLSVAGVPATPTLDRLGRDGVTFARTVAPAPLTLPAHASLFTAKYPPAHGVRDNGGFLLNEHETTWAERMKAAGFATGAFVGAYVLDRRWGVSQGFDTYVDEFDLSEYQDPSLSSVERPANEVADRALGWLEQVATRRFFAWVHFYDAHSPYAPPEPYRSRFADRPYLGEIAFVDSQLARLVAFLEGRRLLEKTIIVLVGDHGESLGEHGETTHGFFAYESVLHVPLILRAPFDALRGRHVTDVVRSVDVMPTVLDLLGLPFDGTGDGRSLVSLANGSSSELGLEAYAEALYPRFHYGWSELRVLRSGRFKFIEAPRPELYDLEQDPAEEVNLYAERRPLADRMAASLRALAHETATAASPAVEVDPDVRARLAALGYVGTFVSGPARDGSARADPKDKIDLFNLLISARELLQDGEEPERGLAALRTVVSKDPDVVDGWLMIGNELTRRRQFEGALDSFRRALALKPDYDLAVMNMANVYRAMGREADALTGYRRLLDLDPNNAQVRYEMARLLLDRDELGEAEDALQLALTQEPKMAAAHNALGALRIKQGRIDVADREIRTALEMKPSLRLAHFNLALIAELRGDLAGAAEAYRREIAIDPKGFMAQFNLGKVFERLGDRSAQVQAYRDAIASNPDFAEGHLFLAQLYLELDRSLGEAMSLARRGLELAPGGRFAPLGHFVISDIHARQGRLAEAEREAAAGRALAARLARGMAREADPPTAAGRR